MGWRVRLTGLFLNIELSKADLSLLNELKVLKLRYSPDGKRGPLCGHGPGI